MLGLGASRQGRVYSRDFQFEDLRHGVASVCIRYLAKWGNYLAGIYLLVIPRYFSSLVISSLINIINYYFYYFLEFTLFIPLRY